jgi:hypothetical protein
MLCHVCPDPTEEARLVRLRLEGPHAVTEGQAKLVVVGKHLTDSDRGLFVNSADSGVFAVEPGSLDICLLLWVANSPLHGVSLIVFSCEARSGLSLLHFKRAHNASG